MHGLLLNQFRQFVVEAAGREAWLKLTLAAGTGTDAYQISGTYPNTDLAALTAASSCRPSCVCTGRSSTRRGGRST